MFGRMENQSRCDRAMAKIVAILCRENERLTEKNESLTEQLTQCQAALKYAELRLVRVEKEKA
jgi:hypothetical protein